MEKTCCNTSKCEGAAKPPLSFEAYQEKAASTAVYGPEARFIYPLLGKISEIGEVAEKLLKAIHAVDETGDYWDSEVANATTSMLEDLVVIGNDAGLLSKEIRDQKKMSPMDIEWAGKFLAAVKEQGSDLLKEFGDNLWFDSAMLRDLGAQMGDVAQANLDKLADRAKRGVIGGSGDNR